MHSTTTRVVDQHILQGLIQDYYEGGGCCYGSRRDKCAKHTSLGVSGVCDIAPQKVLKSACSEIESGAI